MADKRELDGAEAFLRDRLAADEEAALVQRIGPALRAPERLADDFEARLFARIQADRVGVTPISRPKLVELEQPPASHRSWWRRARQVQLSPLAGLAWAAGFAGIVALATLGTLASVRAVGGAAAAQVAQAPAPAAVDTVHVVRFVLQAENARRVALVGDFNEWQAGATQMTPTARPGVWTVDVALPPGRHEYAFVVDGSRWMADPLATVQHDDFGTESSVVTVGRARQATS